MTSGDEVNDDAVAQSLKDHERIIEGDAKLAC
jgi:hypothetical protein